MEFVDLERKAREVRELYESLEVQRFGRSWSIEGVGLGLVGDIGELAKLLQAQAGVRDIEQWKEKLAHELSDVPWSAIILAQYSGIDLEKVFARTMEWLRSELKCMLDA